MKNTIIVVVTMALAMVTQYVDATGQIPQIPAEERPEVLTRGPVHESFAQPVNLDDPPGLTAPIEPPANIDEVLPAEKPTGEQFAWIPGYWTWDSDRNEYIWVSGCWRAVPPGMSWVPGYWAQAETGWQWVAGFWTPVSNNEIEYLPVPPALTGAEPAGLAASPDNVWVPPCWYWYRGQYIQRPGYWLVEQANWVWVPSSYVRTPRGYVFVNGYWDYTLVNRGILFAPVYFPRHMYERPGFFYALDIALDIDNLEYNLFTCPRYSHYYFGDYYDDVYLGYGIFPWFECEHQHTWYDPIYVHARWRNRVGGQRWEEHERQRYGRRRTDSRLRPPQTYREMERRISQMPASERRKFRAAEPMTKLVTRETTPYKFEQISPDTRQQISVHSEKVHKFVDERSNWESQATGSKANLVRVPATDTKVKVPSVKHKEPSMVPPEHTKSAPAKREDRGQAPAVSRKDSPTSPEQKKPPKVTSTENKQNQPDKVQVRTPPVVGKKSSGSLQKKPPPKPVEEQRDQKKTKQQRQ